MTSSLFTHCLFAQMYSYISIAIDYTRLNDLNYTRLNDLIKFIAIHPTDRLEA